MANAEYSLLACLLLLLAAAAACCCCCCLLPLHCVSAEEIELCVREASIDRRAGSSLPVKSERCPVCFEFGVGESNPLVWCDDCGLLAHKVGLLLGFLIEGSIPHIHE